MIKNNKFKLLIASVLTLLPMLFGVIFWDKLPETMSTHWGTDGTADGSSGKAFAVFGIPLILLALFWVCMIATSFDKKNATQSKKALSIIFWIIPCLSFFVNTLMYSAALGREVNIPLLMPILLGAIFILIGNYMPKTKQNYTLGIKIKWTLNNEENWNATHRFTGKIWVALGILIMLCVLLPEALISPIVFALVLIAVLAPFIYSYIYHRKQLK